MIAILLDDNSFEQDIRELLMAFIREKHLLIRGKKRMRQDFL